MMEDPELLRRFAEEKSQEAFAELVRRRVDLVYTVALRHVGGDAHLAHDVTQKVFVDLARKAPLLKGRTVLSGWLYRSAQFAASDIVRSERRRRVREQESHARQEIERPEVSPGDWEKLRPLLAEAMGELNDSDRDAVALRFFEDRPFAEIGRVLRLTEDAARKRVERALDKLGGTLSRRGVTSTSAALGAALANHVAGAAPAGLATNVTTGALAVAGGAAPAGAIAFFTSAKFLTGAGAAAAALGLCVAWQQHRLASDRAAELAALRQEQTATMAKVTNLETRLGAAETRARAAEQDSVELLTAVERFQASRAAALAAGPAAAGAAKTVHEPEGSITRDTVEARYRNGQLLARAGRIEEALREFEWCLDRGMPAVVGYTGVRRSFLLSDIERVGEKGRALLTARRDVAEQALRSEGSFDAAADFAALNRTLGDPERTLAFFDQLAASDHRRRSMGLVVYEQLVERQRYAEAVQARSFATMLRSFELDAMTRPVPTTTAAVASPDMTQARRSYAIRTAARHIEVLAGAGILADARTFAAKVLAFDGSAETRTLLRDHATRAGQPNLLAELSGL